MYALSGLINTTTQMRGSIIFIDETLVGRYRKALNRHLQGDLLYYCLNAVDTGLNGSQMLPSAIMTRFPGTIKEKMKL